MSENKLMKTLKIGNSPTFEICDATARNDVTQLRGDLGDLKFGNTIEVNDTISNIGSYNYNVNIAKGTKVIFKNLSNKNCTLNVSDGKNEVAIDGGCVPNKDVYFVAPFDIKKIRCYFATTSINFVIKILSPFSEITDFKNHNFEITSLYNQDGYHFAFIHIPQGSLVTFINTNNIAITLNVIGYDDRLVTVSGSMATNEILSFVAPFDIKCFKSFANQDSVTFKGSYKHDFLVNKTFDGSVYEDSGSLSNAGNHRTNIAIPKGTLVEFSNNADCDVTLNVGNEQMEVNITNGIAKFSKIQFVCPIDITYIRNWVSGTNYNKTIKVIGTPNILLNDSRDWNSTNGSRLSDAYADEKIGYFCNLLNTTSNVDTFLYFTDPHIYSNNLGEFESIECMFKTLKSVYRKTPCSAVLCGGDWIDKDSKSIAIKKMGEINAYCKEYLHPFYGVLGNHDTNYQEEELSKITQANLWFRGNKGKTYYDFVLDNTRWFALDTDKDWNSTTLRDYDKEQLHWICHELLSNTEQNIAVLMHIIYNTGTTLAKIAEEISKVVIAFNNKSSYTLDGETYDFSSAVGSFRFILGGHTHTDTSTSFGGVPVIIRTTTRQDRVVTFDLVCVDYGTNKISFVRLGSGENASFDI